VSNFIGWWWSVLFSPFAFISLAPTTKKTRKQENKKTRKQENKKTASHTKISYPSSIAGFVNFYLGFAFFSNISFFPSSPFYVIPLNVLS